MAKVDSPFSEGDRFGAGPVDSDLFQQLFGQLHHAPEVRVGLIELQHSELRVVPDGDSLVTEITVDFVNALNTADDQPL